MKDNKDPYNFEKIDGFLTERKRAIGEMKETYGKIYMKSPKAKSHKSDENNGAE